MQTLALQAFEKDEQGELKQFTLSLLRQADINIDEIKVDIVPLNNQAKSLFLQIQREILFHKGK